MIPNDAGAYNIRGLSYLGLKQDDLAIADFSQALRINPNYTAARTELQKLQTASP